MYGCMFVTWELYQAWHFMSSLPGANNKEDGGVPAGTALDTHLSHAAAPRTGVCTASQLHPAGAFDV